MPPVILVAIDDSPRGADALALASALAASLGATLAVVNVRAPVPQPWLPGNDDIKVEIRNASQALLDGARETLGDPPGATYHRPIDSSVPGAVTKVAEETGATLIVVAQTHRGRLLRVAGVAERLLHGAHRAVAVAAPDRAADGPLELRRVVATFDGSPESAEAIGHAAGIARRAAAALRVVGVFDTMTLAWIGPDRSQVSRDYADAMMGELRHEMQAATERFAPGMDAELDVIEGAPADTLIAVSRHSDLLVCGSRGMGPIGATLIGSVSNRLAHSAECAVLAVPEGITLPGLETQDEVAAGSA